MPISSGITERSWSAIAQQVAQSIQNDIAHQLAVLGLILGLWQLVALGSLERQRAAEQRILLRTVVGTTARKH